MAATDMDQRRVPAGQHPTLLTSTDASAQIPHALDWTRLALFTEELRKWSDRMSLISTADRSHLLERHILPSLAPLPLLQAVSHRTIIDFGSGAGLPGVPLALALPGSQVHLVESRRRRVSFLRHVARLLQLNNVIIAHTRLEVWDGPASPADCVITRAARTAATLPKELQGFQAPHGMVIHYLDSRQPGRPGAHFLWRGQPHAHSNVLLECNLPASAPCAEMLPR